MKGNKEKSQFSRYLRETLKVISTIFEAENHSAQRKPFHAVRIDQCNIWGGELICKGQVQWIMTIKRY